MIIILYILETNTILLSSMIHILFVAFYLYSRYFNSYLNENTSLGCISINKKFSIKIEPFNSREMNLMFNLLTGDFINFMTLFIRFQELPQFEYI